MLKINTKHAGWHRSSMGGNGSMACNGIVFLGDTIAQSEALCRMFDGKTQAAELAQQVTRLNGFYALIVESESFLFATVDHVRSRPLFYASIQAEIYLSDDAWWVRKQVGDSKIDPIARDEFLLTGYVTGPDTLYPSVKQLQAGELLVATKTGGNWSIQTIRWYQFWHIEPTHYDEALLRDELEHALVNSIQRLIHYAKGRQIVVPLSGGFDSRIIVTLLRRLGYKKIATFTYGKRGNKESACSKQVADALGLEWHFVEYSRILWHEAWQTEERKSYQNHASMLCSLPVFQDWLAVKILKQQNIFDSDCIFCPGHSGDFVAGSHIPISASAKKESSRQNVIEELHRKHYSLINNESVVDRRLDIWAYRIWDRSGGGSINSGADMANVCEKWNWQERQAKFICNSLRVYEHFGFDWWIPLWDIEFARFWQDVPLSLRVGRKWYCEYINTEYARALDVPCGKSDFAANKGRWRIESLKNCLSWSRQLYRNVRWLYRFSAGYWNGIFTSAPTHGMEGCVSKADYSRHLIAGYSHNGYRAMKTISEIESMDTE